jgi:hypothetical protein
MPSASRYARPSPAPQPPRLTTIELRHMLTPDNVNEVTELLIDHPVLDTQLLHFTSLSRVVTRLQGLLESVQYETDQVFQDMQDQGIDDVLAFFIARERRPPTPPPQRLRPGLVPRRHPPIRPDTPHPRAPRPHSYREFVGTTAENPITLDNDDEHPPPSSSTSSTYVSARETLLPQPTRPHPSRYSSHASTPYERQPTPGPSV